MYAEFAERATTARDCLRDISGHIDTVAAARRELLGTLAGRTLEQLREIESLDELEMRGERWQLTKAAVEQMLCDSSMLATIFDGPGHVLDANDAAERFNRAQRRAIAARDRRCVFPSCDRHPRHCDTHHIEFREHGGPTRTANGCLLCRFHHRLIHQVGWKLTVVNGRWTATSPDGYAYTGDPLPTGPPATRPADAAEVARTDADGAIHGAPTATPSTSRGRDPGAAVALTDPPLQC